ncbi:hypothetical protein EKO04_003550 [Ascochyta lentis]|uniref:Uncharacterized protein n=1 Tax=Ascochyta lentis TaxID=205686 RepID=A0A8H7J4X3_9PLEO|nr:hypothetical protein EKO04_003550 [Ascochyta lentis]
MDVARGLFSPSLAARVHALGEGAGACSSSPADQQASGRRGSEWVGQERMQHEDEEHEEHEEHEEDGDKKGEERKQDKEDDEDEDEDEDDDDRLVP